MLKLEPLPNAEAISFWRDKVNLSPGQFAQLTDAEKTRAFAVSGIAKGAELETVYQALLDNLERGTTFAEFKAAAADVFERRGWTGVAAWRVDNIFRTNVQTAYSVGRYRQMRQAAALRPFWQYDAVNDSRTRPTHRAVNGMIFRHDHPFWDKWYPPNGFRCRCAVRTLSQREIDRDGLTVRTDDPTGGLVEPTTPEGVTMPARLLMPDPGFAHHPGKTVWDGVADAATRPQIWTDAADLKGPADYRRRKLANVRPDDIADFDESMLLADGLPDDVYRDAFIRRHGEEKVVTDVIGEPVILSLRSFMADKTAQTWKFAKAGHGRVIPLVAQMLAQPYEVWLVPQKNETGRIRLTRRYICLWKTADKQRIGGMAVYEVADSVWQGVTNFMPRKKGGAWNIEYLEKQRQGVLLWGKK